jgi:hypothetical protein
VIELLTHVTTGGASVTGAVYVDLLLTPKPTPNPTARATINRPVPAITTMLIINRHVDSPDAAAESLAKFGKRKGIVNE